MKKILLLAFGVLAALPAITQTPIKGIVEPSRPMVEAITGAVWYQKIRIEVKDNTYYEWTIEPANDSARYFQPMDGKRYKAKVTFTEIRDTPVIDMSIVDNSSFTFSPTGMIGVNSINPNGWSQFDADVAPNPDWCVDFHNSSCSFSQNANNTISYTFIGKRIEVYGEKGSNKGIIGFTINTPGMAPVTEQLKDLYAPGGNNQKALLFEADFSQGEHSIVIRITGKKNAASSAAYGLVDNLKIYSQR